MTGQQLLWICLASLAWAQSVGASPLFMRLAEHAERTSAGAERAQALAEGDVVQGRDRISVGDGGRADIAISRHGFIELGDGAVVNFEQLPFSTFDVELLTQLRVQQGYLRLVWKHPDFAARWPMVMDVGPFRINATSGEYFVEHDRNRTVLCIAEGQVAVSTPGQAEAAVLTASSCYRLMSGASAQHAEIAPDQFVAVRQQRALMPLAIDVGLAGGQTRVAQAGPAAVQAPREAAPTATLTPGPTPRATAAPSRQPRLTPEPSLDDARDRAIRGALGSGPSTSAPAENAPPAGGRASPAPAVRAQATTTPAPGAAPAAAGKEGRWALNVASLSERDDALKMQQRLIGKGFTADIVPAEVRGQQWYRVQFRGLASASAARALAKQLEVQAGLSGAWVVPPAQ